MTQPETILGMIWGRWASAKDFVNAGVMQYNARIFDLREKGLDIPAKKVNGYWYYMLDPMSEINQAAIKRLGIVNRT